jgi:hypothetical protein
MRGIFFLLGWDMVYLLYLFYCGLSEIYPRVGYHKTVLYSTRTPTWNIQAKNVKNKLSTAKSSWDGAEKAFEYVKLLLKALQRDTGEEKSLDVEKCTMDKCLEGEMTFRVSLLMRFVARLSAPAQGTFSSRLLDAYVSRSCYGAE